MYLKSVDGKILFEGRFTNIRQGVEMAVADKCDLTAINLRKVNLSNVQMDNAIMPKACLWGANLNEANMTSGKFEGADFRTANLLNSCLAEADCAEVNFEGAYFSKTIFTDCDLSKTKFSCPSIFNVELAEVASLEGAIYSHLGEIDCDLSHAPLIIRGLHKPFIFMDDVTLVGNDLHEIALRQHVLEAILGQTSDLKIKVNQ